MEGLVWICGSEFSSVRPSCRRKWLALQKGPCAIHWKAHRRLHGPIPTAQPPPCLSTTEAFLNGLRLRFQIQERLNSQPPLQIEVAIGRNLA